MHLSLYILKEKASTFWFVFVFFLFLSLVMGYFIPVSGSELMCSWGDEQSEASQMDTFTSPVQL